MDTLLDIIKKEGQNIIDEFKLSSKQGEGTPQEISDFRENAIQDFLQRFYPKNHIISKGKITGMDGNQSASIDCLILNPAHPNLIDSRGKFRLIFADGCDAAIEVKPDLKRTDELYRALKQGITLKKIKRSKSAIIFGSVPKHIVEHSKYIPFYIFSGKSFEPKDITKKINEFYSKNKTPLEHQIDGICTLDYGFIKLVKHKELNLYGDDPNVGKKSGWFLESWGGIALLGLLTDLEYSYKSNPGVSESIMKRVLKNISTTNVAFLNDVIV